MARHRNIRQLGADDISTYDEALASSVDEDYGISPSIASMYLFDSSKASAHALPHAIQGKANTEHGVRPLLFSADDFPANEDTQSELSPGLVSGRICSKPHDSFSQFNAEPGALFDDIELNELMVSGPEDSLRPANQSISTVQPKRLNSQIVPDANNLPSDFTEKLSLTDGKLPQPDLQLTPRPLVSTAQPSYSSPNKPVDRRPLLNEYNDRRQRAREKDVVNLIVLGHVDAGKSTLMGNLLFQLGQVSGKQIAKYRWEAQKLGKASFAYAWVLDQTTEERTRGVTMDIAQTTFETKTKRIALMDAPGHRDFVPRVIGGASQADVALLVVNATNGEFETGFGAGGQTREHTRLARLLGVSRLVVAVNKMDTVNWDKCRFESIRSQMTPFLKSLSLASTVFCPVSGLTGVNLLPPDECAIGSDSDAAAGVAKLASWYDGPCLVNVIDGLPSPERTIDGPFRFVVTDIFKPVGLGVPAVAGRVVCGAVSAGMGLATSRVFCQPSSVPATVKSIRSLCAARSTGSESGEATDSSANLLDQSTKYAFAGDQVALILNGVDPFQSLACGDLISDPDNPVPLANRISAKILLFAVPQAITRGSPVIFHHTCTSVPATISKLKSMTCKENKVEKTLRKPRCLTGNCTADVEITLDRAVCLEVYEKCKPLGRFMLRVGGESIAGGTVTEILPPRKNRLDEL